MSDQNDGHNAGPVFNQPEGVPPFSEEQTLPFVDLYPQSDNLGGASPYGADEGSWNPGPYGAQPQSGSQYPSQQYADPPYQQNPQYGQDAQYNPNVNPSQPMGTVPQQQQPYGYYGYAPVEHPQSTTVLVLALVGLVMPVTAFIAWYMGNKAKAEIERGAPFPYSGSLKIGHIIGKVVSILTIAGAALYGIIMVIYVIFIVGMLSNF